MLQTMGGLRELISETQAERTAPVPSTSSGKEETASPSIPLKAFALGETQALILVLVSE